MKLDVEVKLNLRDKEVQKEVRDATRKALKDVTTDIAQDVIHGSPHVTGNNMRMIAYEIEGGGVITVEGDTSGIGTKELESAVCSTSGYGGYLETGTSKMPARPYFKPALDKNMKNLPREIKANLT